MQEYNGHKSYNYWNVSMWLFSDEELYRIVQEATKPMKTREPRNLNQATDWIRRRLEVNLRTKDPHTPDGVPFLKSYIREAIRDEIIR